MAKIEDLIAQVSDTFVRKALAEEVRKLKATTRFGLVYEEHIPEVVEIPGVRPRRGDLVIREPEDSSNPWRVDRVVGGNVRCVRGKGGEREEAEFEIASVTVVKQFGDPIYPALDRVDAIQRGGDKRSHLIIQADNYHALQLLQYTHAAAVDLIYIVPPYNTGAKDWKYNNDYVDKNDSWRHSKWLSMMKKRLLLAKRLLKEDGVLVVAIDENEHATLTLLLKEKELFYGHDITSVSVVHNPRGVQGDNFSFTHEYAVFVTPAGKKILSRVPVPGATTQNFRNWGGESLRTDAANCFYPIYVENGEIVGFGDVLPPEEHPEQAVVDLGNGRLAVWPIDDEGVERKWRYERGTVEGIAHLLRYEEVSPAGRTRGPGQRIQMLRETEPYKTVWIDPRFDASTHGTQLVRRLINREFPYPKSLYALTEVLQAVTADKRDAVVVDFFGGSGTTLHATMLQNAIDGGSRQCILVTNNELDPKTARQLRREGIRPGDRRWEREGICEAVTWPRCRNALLGSRDGEPLEGTYRDGRLMSEGFDENLTYLKLEFLDPDQVALGRAFEAILPILWVAGGARGPVPEVPEGSFLIAESGGFAVLLDERAYQEFAEKIAERQDIRIAFLVTDSEASFREMLAEMPNHVECRQLYKSYLENFRINTHAVP